MALCYRATYNEKATKKLFGTPQNARATAKEILKFRKSAGVRVIEVNGVRLKKAQ